jgi:hypothetical protein
MKVVLHVFALAALVLPLAGAKSTGPVRLLSCAVSRAGLLEAEVENASDSAQTCKLRCEYVIHATTVSHWFEVTVPARFSGIAGQFDTARGLPGKYPGQLGVCRMPATH